MTIDSAPAGRARLLDSDFVDFVLSRSDAFLARYGSISDCDHWRQQQRQILAAITDGLVGSALDGAIQNWVDQAFGSDRLPLLRRRYNTERHRRSKLSKPFVLSNDLRARLDRVQTENGLDSTAEAIQWLLDCYAGADALAMRITEAEPQ